MEEKETYSWWKHGVFYHIYPKSFKDSNGDGVGDIPGIIEKLDYLVDLGIDAIWLSPVYKSPMVDFGYDISGYRKIDPLFGSMEDLKELIAQVHSRGMKLVMDLVMNHTSDQHPWFVESRSSIDNPKRDWYIWREPKNGKIPNNWITNFGSAAWTYDKHTKQYYYHSFFKEQPDLNWRNEDMKRSFFEKIQFWLNLGIDGFRLDVINLLIKEKTFRNSPLLSNWFSNGKVLNRNQPRTFKILQEFRALLDTSDNKMSIGEIYVLPPGDTNLVAQFLGKGDDMLHMAFDFSLIFCSWNACKYHEAITKWYGAIPPESWPCFVLSNHDLGRFVKRYSLGIHKYAKAKLLATLLLTLRGTPFIYYGDEIGMENSRISKKDIKDPYGKKFWPFYTGRDKARTPMQWNSDENGGFSNTTPWLPVSESYKSLNVEDQLKDEDSMLNFYRQLIKVRKEYPSLSMGNWHSIIDGVGGVLAYERRYEKEEILIVLNFSYRRKSFSYQKLKSSFVLVSTHRQYNTMIETHEITLQAYEATVLKLFS
ncbi:glycoside hydrolase family 13 protein [Dysgonomonas sp. GY617]|uniref:glycoside hydrolase family 13 protein n=1 Tax=Dysgonomonas sp. GY617 TaxID=2780420 RepID=UPI00188344F1|nr:alpha-glucosidase [Dysgonomonas sp. GY617]MBF0575043.1 alpha-glucosidase [Dysgonomonas sp. GY617]